MAIREILQTSYERLCCKEIKEIPCEIFDGMRETAPRGEAAPSRAKKTIKYWYKNHFTQTHLMVVNRKKLHKLSIKIFIKRKI